MNPEPTDDDVEIVRIFDTTLRDGEQSPGATLNFEEKLEIARHLEALGVDIIEAGFPIASVGDFESVREIAHELGRATVAGLARCIPGDIDRAGEALGGAPHPRIHVFCATSKIHREHKLKKPIERIIEMSVESVQRARGFVEDVEFSPEDGSRTELNYLVDITGATIEAGATTINIPDTVGYAVPEEYGHIFKHVREQLPEIDAKGIILSSHCHDDLGLAVANSLAAVANGARQVECTINGLGERAGNASLEEVVMALRTRADYFKRYATRIDTRKIYPISRMVSAFTGLHVQRNKAIVGDNAFAHEAGIHQHGVLAHSSTYEIMSPQDVGIPSSKLVLGKHSGRHALRDRLGELGHELEDEQLDVVFDRFKALADKKKEVFDEDLEVLVAETLENARIPHLWKLVGLQTSGGTSVIPTATVRLQNQTTGEEVQDAATGDGPIDAAFTCLLRLMGCDAVLKQYDLRALTSGRDAQGTVRLEVESGGKRYRGRGVSTDIIEASALAFVNAINRILAAGNGTKRQDSEQGACKAAAH